jgi:hypothetical protein
MNDLLQRLVQRTVAPSAAVEPLYKPRFAVAGSSPSGIREIEVTDDPPTARDKSIAPGAGTRTITDSALTRDPSGLFETVTTIEAGAARGVGFSPAVTEGGAHRAIETRGDSDFGSNGHERLRPWQTVTASEKRTTDEETQVAAEQTSQPLRSDTPARDFGKRQQTNSQPTVPQFAPRDARSKPSVQSEDSSSSPSREITISIGHIEVRNVPAPAKPRRPAFRPRVTLDEFLKGQAGDRP